MAMAIALPILISAFGFNPDALLPVMGFLIGVMKGATVGGAVPAILFNTPGTPQASATQLPIQPDIVCRPAQRKIQIGLHL